MATSAVHKKLSKYAKVNFISCMICLPPVLDHFVKDKSKTFGISKSEFIRRLLWPHMERYMELGLYELPKQLLDCSPTEIKMPSLSDYTHHSYPGAVERYRKPELHKEARRVQAARRAA